MVMSKSFRRAVSVQVYGYTDTIIGGMSSGAARTPTNTATAPVWDREQTRRLPVHRVGAWLGRTHAATHQIDPDSPVPRPPRCARSRHRHPAFRPGCARG